MQLKVNLKDLVTDADIKAEIKKLSTRCTRLERQLSELRDKCAERGKRIQELECELEDAQKFPEALKDLIRRCGIDVGD